MRPLRVGIWDHHFRGFDQSITHGQALPASLEYHDRTSDGMDVVMATMGSGDDVARLSHPCKVLWLQERHGFGNEEAPLGQFDLVLSNNVNVVLANANARWLSLLGTWLKPGDGDAPKTKMTSFIASSKYSAPGHALRHDVARMGLLPSSDVYGALMGRPIADKAESLLPYRFQVVIESDRYNWWVTEKTCDAFAARTVPLLWGCPDLSPLTTAGFDIAGILPWQTITGLRERLAVIASRGAEIYEEMMPAVEANHRRIWERPSTEHWLEPLLREHFGL